MSIQLSREQEQRIQTFVDRGLYTSTDEMVNAALGALEQHFEGSQEDLESLLMDGLNSGAAIEMNEDFWKRLREETDRMVSEHQAAKQRAEEVARRS